MSQHQFRLCLLLSALLLVSASWLAAGEVEAPKYPYADDPAIIEILKNLKPGESKLLPRPTAWGEGRNLSELKQGTRTGPIHRDYSNRLVYVPDRGTAFYCGGGHAHRRYNDAWEYHLGSNTWIRLLPPDGGDQGKTKAGWFVCRKLIRDPHAKLSEKEQTALDNIRAWFQEYAIIKDGYVQTKNTGAGFMTSHNWDGVTYDPNTKQILHAAGHCKSNDWECYFLLMGDHTPDNFHEKLAEFQKTLRMPKSEMWVFDFATNKWLRNYHNGPPVETFQGGSFFCYIPDLKQSLYYNAHKTPNMMFHDAVKNTWTKAAPNNGTPLGDLIHKEKQAPLQEQQVAYSPKHRKLVAVIGEATHVYDIDTKEWSQLPETRPLLAHDARTLFDYDSVSDTFLLVRAGKKSGEGSFYSMSLTDGKWKQVTPDGPLPAARWSPGSGFYHPEHNVFVVHLPNQIWVYRHQAR